MLFLGLDRNMILRNSRYIHKLGLFEYFLGSPVQVMTNRKSNLNDVLYTTTSDKKSDKLMVKYNPSNSVFFTKRLLLGSGVDGNVHVSVKVDSGNRVIIGDCMEFAMASGILTFSGFMGYNNLVEEERTIFGNNKNFNLIKKKIKILSIGISGNKLYGLYYIPSSKGIGVSTGRKPSLCISPYTLKEIYCDGFDSYSIDDWFKNTRVKELQA